MEKRLLKKLQEAEIEILDYLDELCKKNNLKYFMMYGTLLGAVRHKGFIPWDDDIDVGMLRDDYEKLIKILENEKHDKFKMDYININKNYYLPFVKIKNIKTIHEEKTSINYNGNKGIWIDIFPFDNIKTSEYSKIDILKQKITMILYSVMISKSLKIYKYKLIKILSKFFTNEKCIKIIDKIRINNNSYDYVVPFVGDKIKDSPIINKNDIFPLKKLVFNNNMYCAPKNYKKVLEKLYGSDYMELPPIEKRVTHGTIRLKFEDGKEYKIK